MASSFWSAFRATFRAVFADRSVVLLLVGAAVLYSFFYPSAYSGEVPEHIPIAVVDEDNSGLSRAFLVKLGAVQQADIRARALSGREALQMMQKREVDAFVVIPSGFEQSVLRGEAGWVNLYGNGAFLLRSSTSLAGIGAALGDVGRQAGLAQAMAQGAPAAAPLDLIQRPLFNTREGYGSAVVPAVTFLIIQQTILMGLAMLAATLREQRGPYRFALPSLGGIACAFLVIGLAVVIYWTGFVFWFQDYPRAGADIVTLLVAALLFVAATVAAAMALASFLETRERPVQLWIVTSLPIYFLANLSWPAEATPQSLVWLGRLLPSTPGIHLMIGINQMGASLSEQRTEVLNLLFLILLYGGIAVWRLGTRSPAPLSQAPASPGQ